MNPRAHGRFPDWNRLSSVDWAIAVARAFLARPQVDLTPSRRSGLVSGLRVGLWREGVPFLHRERALELIRWAGDGDGPLRCPLIAGAWLDAVAPLTRQARACLEAAGAWEQPLHPKVVPGEGVAVEVLSGLPGAGKDHWRSLHRCDWPVVSLDELRARLGLAADAGDVPELRTRAEALATRWLTEGRPFVWSATNLRRRQRRALIAWLSARGAAVTLRTLEVPWPVQRPRNRRRMARVPEPAVLRMLERWEPPWPGEAPVVAVHEAGHEVPFT
jgi:predicted kinase